jgi:recombination protein RecR
MLPDRIRRIVQRLSRLPGVGEKTALRYAMFLITADESASRELGEELLTLHEQIRPCSRCAAIAEVRGDEPVLCPVCLDPKRDPTLICVVARVQDMLAIERSKAMRGSYMVLGKLLSPLDGVGPGDLPLAPLRSRIRSEGVTEVIVATPPSVDGEATALYLARELSDLGVRISRLASGVPHGGDLEYADQITLGRAIDGRRKIVS